MGGVSTRTSKLGALVALFAAVGLVGCATTSGRTAGEPADPSLSAAATSADEAAGSVYQDRKLGFAVVRPSSEWELEANEFFSEEGISIPLMLRHVPSGSQIVLQIAPDVATPTEYAQRMTEGLQTQAGFHTTDVEPIPLTDASVGFFFTLGEDVLGRVAIREGSPGNIFMVMATWPNGASEQVLDSIDSIIASIQPVISPQFAARPADPKH